MSRWKLKAGSSVAASKAVNCGTCKRRPTCDDPRKAEKFACSRFFPTDIQTYLRHKMKTGKHGVLVSPPEVTLPAVPVRGPTSKLIGGFHLEMPDFEAGGSTAKYIVQDQYPDDFDITPIIDDVLSQDSPLPRDIRVKDDDLPQALNLMEFLISPSFMKAKPFAAQLQIGLKLFSEWCPRCTTEENKEWWDGGEPIPVKTPYEEISDRIVLLEHGKCPKCGVGRAELFKKRELYKRQVLAALIGQRAGKSFMSAFMMAYQIHWYLKTPNPMKLFDLDAASQLHATVVSLTFGKAKENVFDPLNAMVSEGHWFKEYHKLLDYYGGKFGDQFYKLSDIFIKYTHKSLYVYPATPDKRKLRGNTRLFATLDEVGWFMAQQEGSIKYDVDEIYNAINNSFSTMRNAYRNLLEQGYNNIVPPMFYNISSPSSRLDKICRLYRESKERKTILGVHLPTWKVNPRYTKQELIEDAPNYDVFLRDYKAAPPLSHASFIDDMKHLEKCCHDKKVNAITLVPKVTKTRSEKTVTTADLVINWVENRVPKIMCLDAGHTNNSFAFAVGHNELTPSDSRRRDRAFMPVVDIVGEVIPKRDRPVSHTMLFKNVLLPIIKKFNVQMVLADRWQSIKILQDIDAELGIDTQQYSLKYWDFELLQQDVYNANIRFPKPEKPYNKIVSIGDTNYPEGFKLFPVSHLLFQFLTVQDMGDDIEKGENTTDDIFRATALLHAMLSDEKFDKKFSGFGVSNSIISPIGAMVGSQSAQIPIGGVPMGQGQMQITGDATMGNIASRPTNVGGLGANQSGYNLGMRGPQTGQRSIGSRGTIFSIIPR